MKFGRSRNPDQNPQRMPLWLIPLNYVAAGAIGATVIPRVEHEFPVSFALGLSVSSAQACLSAAASGMMALTAIVFAIAFVMVQFSAVAYSPRVVLRFIRDRAMFHTLGIFIATFIFSLWTLAWVDRGQSGEVPMVSVVLVAMLVIVSMILFSRLVDRLNGLHISSVLHSLGDSGRETIAAMFRRFENGAVASKTIKNPLDTDKLGPPTQTLRYRGPPRTVSMFMIDDLVKLAQHGGGVIVMACAVGDTLVDGAVLLEAYGCHTGLPERDLRKAIRLAKERTFAQDPKYPIRLLVDIAIRALSPAVNDPTSAVQTIDQLEDLLRRLGRNDLDVGNITDAHGVLRLSFPVPTWEDYLALAFDEIRQYGSGSVQVMRRLRSALFGVADSLISEPRARSVQKFLEHLDSSIERAPFDVEDRTSALQEDRQGIGLSRTRPAQKAGIDAA